MTFIQGRALTDASKRLCATAKKGPLVTLDKAGDYHINLCVALPCLKHTGPPIRPPALLPASPAASHLVAHGAAHEEGEK